MFRCRECKGWLKIGKIDTEISNQNCKIKVQNMPVKFALNVVKFIFMI